jgi:hypothetical protein
MVRHSILFLPDRRLAGIAFPPSKEPAAERVGDVRIQAEIVMERLRKAADELGERV